jgi:cytoskeleton protein RodZ
MTASDTTTRVVSESGNDVGPGRRLREAREAAQLTVAEVASRMRLEPHAVEQLENDNYERLHGSTFVRGYLSGYARLLRLPEGPILEAYERQGYGPPALVSELGRKAEVHVSDFPVRMVTYVIAGLLVVLVVLWWQSRQLPTGAPERADVAVESVQQASGSPENDGGRADFPAAAGVDPSPAPALETSESQAAEDPPEITAEGDTQPPPATMGVEQGDASDTAPLQAPPGEGVLVDDSQSNGEAGAENGAPADALAAAAGDESAAEAATEAGGAADSGTEIVASVRDSAEPAEGDTTASPPEVEEQAAAAPRPAPLPGSDVLAIALATESWVEIYDRGGGRLFYSLAREGSEIVVQGAGPMRVLLGDVEGAVVAYNGEPYDLSRYQGRSVVHFTVGELSSTTAPEPPAPAAEPLTRETTADEPGPSVADASDALSTPGQEPGMPGSAPISEPLPGNPLPAPSAGDTPRLGFHVTQPDS